MTKKRRYLKNWVKEHKETFEMFAWFWGANTLMAVFLILVYRSMMSSCAVW
jgi:hypothetical protein